MRLISSLIATATAVLLIPGAAHAATLSYEGDTLVYRADPGVRDHPMVGGENGRLTVFADNLALAAGCTYDYEARCPMPARVRLELGDGDDGNSFDSDYP